LRVDVALGKSIKVTISVLFKTFQFLLCFVVKSNKSIATLGLFISYMFTYQFQLKHIVFVIVILMGKTKH
jgi:hypothetical protein